MLIALSVQPYFRRARGAVVILLMALLAACGAPPTVAQTVVETKTSDGITFALERPTQPVSLRNYEFVVTLSDAAGDPVDASSVYLDFTMPQMVMGVNQPIAERTGPGRYRAQTVYSMEGDWRITVVATIEGREVRAEFDHPVQLP